jgi:hypothetical protein
MSLGLDEMHKRSDITHTATAYGYGEFFGRVEPCREANVPSVDFSLPAGLDRKGVVRNETHSASTYACCHLLARFSVVRVGASGLIVPTFFRNFRVPSSSPFHGCHPASSFRTTTT